MVECERLFCGVWGVGRAASIWCWWLDCGCLRDLGQSAANSCLLGRGQRFTCSRTDPRDALCCPCESRAMSCTCHVPGAHSHGESYHLPSLSFRRVTAPDLASGPAKERESEIEDKHE